MLVQISIKMAPRKIVLNFNEVNLAFTKNFCKCHTLTILARVILQMKKENIN